MRILFMGTPDFARESLEKLYYSGYEICGVITPPDRPKGRGLKKIACPVKQFALEKQLPIFQPEKLKEIKEEMINMVPDIIVVVSYGKFLPKSVLAIPKYGCINVHPSLLPKYRGSAPIQWAIINGDKITGTTIMEMNEKMDAGDIILQKAVEIGENETTGELWNRLSIISSNLLIEAIKQIESGTALKVKQGQEYTLAPMINKEIAQINWQEQDSLTIKNLVRGLNPSLGAYCKLGQKKIKLWKVEILQNEIFENIEAGTVLIADCKKGLYIKTIDGAIKVLEIQGENARKMSIEEFLRGNKIESGEKLL